MSIVLNNSIKYSSTYLASIEVLFSFKIKEPLDLLNGLRLEDLIEYSIPLRLNSSPALLNLTPQKAIPISIPIST